MKDEWDLPTCESEEVTCYDNDKKPFKEAMRNGPP